MDDRRLRPLNWVGGSFRDYIRFPEPVQEEMGFALYRAQIGERHPIAKTMKGFGGGGVLELAARHDGNAYRAVYTVRFAEAVYVLHAFQKKSKKSVATPRGDIDLVRRRLGMAEKDYRGRHGAVDDKAKGR